MNVVVLDSEALSVAARRHPVERHAVVHAALTAARNLRKPVLMPAAVLAEQYRGRGFDAAIDAFLSQNGSGIVIVPTDRDLARGVGHLLARAGGGSAHHVDATVVAVAAQAERSVVLTGDRTDIDHIAAPLKRVAVRHI